MSRQAEMGLHLHCGAAACWLRAMRGVCDEEPFPESAFSSLGQQRAYRRYLQLRSAASLALVLYLLLPFFGPPHPPQASSNTDGDGGEGRGDAAATLKERRPALRRPASRNVAAEPGPETKSWEASALGISAAACQGWECTLHDGFGAAALRVTTRQTDPWLAGAAPEGSSFSTTLFPVHSRAVLGRGVWSSLRKRRFLPRRGQATLQSFEGNEWEFVDSAQTQNLLKLFVNAAEGNNRGFSNSAPSRVYRPPTRGGSQPSSPNSGSSTGAPSQGQPSPLGFLFWSLWKPLPLSFRAQCALLSLLALCCCCVLVAYGVCGVAARGVAKESLLPALASLAATVSAVDFAFLLLKMQPPAQAAATAAAGGWVVTRLSRPLLLLSLHQPVHSLLLRVVKTLPKVKSIIVALFLSVALFDWLGVILFAGTGGHEEFHSFQRGCISLLLVVTTVRLPQVLLCGYTVHEAAVLFIVVFYLIAAILLGLFAAAFFSAYREEEEAVRLCAALFVQVLHFTPAVPVCIFCEFPRVSRCGLARASSCRIALFWSACIQDRRFLRSLRLRYLREAFNRLRQAGEGCLTLREWMVALLGLAALPAPPHTPGLGDPSVPCWEEGVEDASVGSVLAASAQRSWQESLGTAALVSPQANADGEDFLAGPPVALAVVDWRQPRGEVGEGFGKNAFPTEAVEEEALCAGRSLLTGWQCDSRNGKRAAWSGCLTVSESTTLRYAKESFLRLCRGEDGLASSVTFEEFVEVPAVLEYHDWKGSRTRFDTQRFESPEHFAYGICNLVADVAVGVALVVTFTQTQKFIRTASSLTGEPIEEEDAEGMPFSCFASPAASYWLQLGLTLIYFVSAALMLGGEVSRQGLSNIRTVNKFDGLVGGVEILVEALCLAAGASSAFHPESAEEILDDLSRCLAIVRVVRGLRIGFRIKPLKQMVTRLARAVRRLQTVLLLLLVLYYAYAVVGIELFGGIIECELEEYSGSEPEGDPSDWGLLNFNDLFSALVTLFLLTVNGWDDSLKALVKNTSVFKCGAYFVSFYILTDTILLNLLVALVLEAYEQVSAPRPTQALSQDERPPESRSLPQFLTRSSSCLESGSRSSPAKKCFQ